jgi:hypothetical protein
MSAAFGQKKKTYKLMNSIFVNKLDELEISVSSSPGQSLQKKLSFFVLCFSHVLRKGLFSITYYYNLLYQTLFLDPPLKEVAPPY